MGLFSKNTLEKYPAKEKTLKNRPKRYFLVNQNERTLTGFFLGSKQAFFWAKITLLEKPK